MARKAHVPQVGILVECGRDGLEVHLCRKICKLLRDNHGASFAEVIVPMDNKKRLIEECATTAARLLAEGCDRIVVLWDEEPAWPDKEESLCWHEERKQLLEDLRASKIPTGTAHLVCIERACESWLLSDDDLLSRLLSRKTHPVRVRPPANPHTLNNVKGVLMRIFRKHGRPYVDVTWATRIAAALEDLRDCPIRGVDA